MTAEMLGYRYQVKQKRAASAAESIPLSACRTESDKCPVSLKRTEYQETTVGILIGFSRPLMLHAVVTSTLPKRLPG